jgi:hypothetical protein
LPTNGLRATRLGALGAAVGLPREHDHRQRVDAMALAHPLEHRPAVEARHHHVEQHEVRRVVVERPEALLGRPRLAHRSCRRTRG